MARTELFARQQPGGMFTIAGVDKHPGDIYFVSSGSGTDAAGYGYNPDSPVATVDYAISNLCTANKGDAIYALPGHAESITTATTLVADVAGVAIIGLGTGSLRPTLTVQTNATASVVISAANVRVKNFLFVCGTDGINGGVTLSGADAIIEDCEFRDATDVEADIWIAVTGARPTIRNCFFNGFVTGDQQEAMINLAGVANALIENCRFFGKVITGCVNFSTAVTNCTVRDCLFYRNTTTDLSLNVVDTATGSTWQVVNGFDLALGARFSGGSGAALATDDTTAVAANVSTLLDQLAGTTGIASFGNAATPANGVSIAEVLRQVYAALEGTAAGQNGVATWPTAAAYANNVSLAEVLGYIQDAVRNGAGTGLASNKSIGDALGSIGTSAGAVQSYAIGELIERCVEKAVTTIPNNTTVDLFTVSGGPVIATLTGLVTTVVGGAANAKFQHTTVTPAATVELNAAAVAIDNDAAGTIYRNVGATSVFTPSTALGVVLSDPVTVEEVNFFLAPGTVKFHSSATQTGEISFYLRYRPLSPSARVVAA